MLIWRSVLTFYKLIGIIGFQYEQESRAVARKPRDAAAVVFGLKFADNIHHKFKSNQASKARLQSSKCTGAKQNLTQNGDSGSFKVTDGRTTYDSNTALALRASRGKNRNKRPIFRKTGRSPGQGLKQDVSEETRTVLTLFSEAKTDRFDAVKM